MKKAMMTAAGIVTAMSVAAATGLMMSSGSVRRVAKNAAEAVEDTGKRMGRIVKKMK